MTKLSLTEFIALIKSKSVEGNHTYLSAITPICKYGQSYPNTVNTAENMSNHFAVYYYPIYEQDFEDYERAQELPY